MVCHLHGKYFHSYPPDCDHLEMLVSIRYTLKEVLFHAHAFKVTCKVDLMMTFSVFLVFFFLLRHAACQQYFVSVVILGAGRVLLQSM